MKIGLVSFSAKVNCYNIVQEYLKKTYSFLSNTIHQISFVENVILTEDDLNRAIGKFNNDAPDLIVMEIGSFTPGEFIVKFAQSFKNTPFFLRGYNDPIVETHHTIPLNSMTGLLMATSYFKRLKIPFDWVYGDVDDEKCLQKLNLCINAINLKVKLKNRRYAVIGSRAPGFYLSNLDELNFRREIGPEIIYCSLATIIENAKTLPQDKVDSKIGELKKKAKNNVLSDVVFEKNARLMLAVIDYVKKNRIDALTLKCWSELQDLYGCAGCSTLSELNDLGIPASCEGDLPGLVTMDILHCLTGKTPFFADLVCRCDGAGIKAWHCGFGPFSLSDGCGEKCFIEQATMRNGYGAGHQYTMKLGRVTMCKFSEYEGEYRIFAASGQTKTPDRKILGVQTDIIFDAGFDRVLSCIVENGLEQHYAIIHEDVSEQIKEFAKWMNMTYLEEKAGE